MSLGHYHASYRSNLSRLVCPLPPACNRPARVKRARAFPRLVPPYPVVMGQAAPAWDALPFPTRRPIVRPGTGERRALTAAPHPPHTRRIGDPCPTACKGSTWERWLGVKGGGACWTNADRIGRPKHIRAPRNEHSPMRHLHGTRAPATRNSRQGRRAEGAVCSVLGEEGAHPKGVLA